ncbi:MAG: amidase, partial [Rhodoferax sp.]|nr:amidase [Rhodoferax sp.]
MKKAATIGKTPGFYHGPISFMNQDLHATLLRLASGQSSSSGEMEQAIAAAQSPRCRNVFLLPMFDTARARAGEPGVQALPLRGLSFSAKDLFDLAGQVTTAGSRILTDQPKASTDSAAVARLNAAGGALIGRTNMVEFAFSGVGINPHFGTPSAWDGRYDMAPGPIPGTDQPVPRVPGGSSSGAAVSVATGAAF